MPLFSSPWLLAYFLLAVVALTGVLPLATSSRHHAAGGVATDGAPPARLEGDQELLMTERFHGWMAKHGRSYATAEEKLRRLEIYRKNVEFIEAANRDGRLSYTLGENAFTDLTHEEFLAAYTSPAPPPELMTEEEEDMVITTRAGHVSEGANFLPAADEVPDYVDWRQQGKVTGIKYMGKSCGACWAFAAVAAIESEYAIKNDVEPPVLSEQELIDCDTIDDGCRGGLPQQAFSWLMDNGGIAEEWQYPYVNQNDNKSHACQKDPRQTYPVKIKNYGYVGAMSEEKLMQAVARQPVAVRFGVTDLCLQHYRRGRYDGECIKEGGFVVNCSSNILNHAMAIVGYKGKGSDTDKYWIAKNSWGTEWGADGYFYIRKDVADPEGLCGIVKTSPSFPVVA
ncbi:hypothetical protein U9M48_025277 [Paspalum notatum var. saurae]|uniref:Uncharacterized protein n=1 Tax=Paspalum notatum var. saurae TaxID=547442 RepID=A0AAQ3TSY2_PASNO